MPLTIHDPLTALHQVLCRIEELLAGETRDEDGYFGNHPLPLTEFLANMRIIGQPRQRFLDLGSGIGMKLLLAHHLGWPELFGVERNSELVDAARRLAPEATIIHGDAFSHDCSGYDVVYSYRLCLDLDRQAELGRHIAETADEGTLVIYPGAEFGYGEYLGESVWRL